MSLLPLFGWTLACVSTVTVIPQAVRLYRSNDPTGIAVPTVALVTATMTLWCIYTWSVSDWPAFGSSVGPLLAWSSILLWLVRNSASRALALSITGGVVYVALCSLCDVAHVGAAAGSLVWALPQAYESVRRGDLSGVSTLAYAAIAGENIGWIVYAIGTKHWAYAVAPVLQAPLAILIAIRAATAHHRGKLAVRS